MLALLSAGCAEAPEGPGTGTERTGTAEQHLQSCITIQRGLSGTLYDTMIASNHVGTNYGADNVLTVQNTQELLIRADLSAIPAAAAIDSATLKLYINATGNGAAVGIISGSGNANGLGNGNGNNVATAPINLHRATSAWSEGGANYASFAQHFDPAIAGVILPSETSSLKSVDIKALVQAWVSGAQPNGGVLLETTDSKSTIFVSSESGAASLRPAIEICYIVPDNHCAPNPCQNAGTCTNSAAAYTCACTPGFTGTNCEININDCAGNPCLNGGACTDGLNSYTCACPAGFTGANCQTNIDECAPLPCQNGGICTDGVNSYTCACLPGFTGANCQTNIDECSGTPCLNGGACTDGANSYSCACATGFAGTNCETNIDDCIGNLCVNGSSCIDGIAAYTCACPPGFNGTHCEINIDECAGAPCQNGGSCSDGFFSYTCACAAGYSGTNCEVDINDCIGSPCQNAGICVDGVNTYTCQCAAGYSGATCQNAVVCPAGFTGPNCDVDIDECASGDPCHLNDVDPYSGVHQGAACVNTPGSFTCQCSTSYAGATCTVGCPCIDTAGPAGDAENVLNWTTMLTTPVLAFPFCVVGPQYPLFVSNGPAFVQVSGGACWSGRLGGPTPHYLLTADETTACTDIIGDAIARSNITCYFDRCQPNPCQHGGTCSNQTCNCPAGWTGQDCEIDIDECASGDPCHVNTTEAVTQLALGVACVNTPGSFTCQCGAGGGPTCDACPCIDAALAAGDPTTSGPWVDLWTGAAAATTCGTSAVSTTIADAADSLYLDTYSCSSGLSASNGTYYYFQSDGERAACQKVVDAIVAGNPSLTCTYDYCANFPCSNGGTCANGPTGYTCTCAPGFDGPTCDGGCPCLIDAANAGDNDTFAPWINLVYPGAYSAFTCTTDASGTTLGASGDYPWNPNGDTITLTPTSCTADAGGAYPLTASQHAACQAVFDATISANSLVCGP
jgi:hypothetical protein